MANARCFVPTHAVHSARFEIETDEIGLWFHKETDGD